MKETSKSFLKLFFNEGETVCVSDCQGGYHSIEQDLSSITLVSPKEEKSDRKITEDDVNLVAINPVNGWRRDSYVTAYRSFLIEIDEGSLEEQSNYIEELGLPYSICVYSGNKSLHYGIVLSEDLPSKEYWRTINQWLLNVIEKADQQTKNPTRSIRFPGNIRKDGKKLEQKLVKINKRIDLATLLSWLEKFPDKKPRKPKKNLKKRPIDGNFIRKIPFWVKDSLEEGVSVERNNTWFKLTCAMAKEGFKLSEIVDIFDDYFIEEEDFLRREFETSLKSAYSKVTGEEYE